MSAFGGIYSGKKVLVTGHTGFKGSWMSSWLIQMGAHVFGYSKDIPTNPSMFEKLNLGKRMAHHIGDIRDEKRLARLVAEERPDFVFHLAAQAIVSTSYKEPLETLTSNVVGTANVLEALRLSNHNCVAVIITSDKCYDNVEWVWGYRETDGLGGKDIYSGSKGAAELAIKSYYHSFFKHAESNVRLGIARAGNVIGGGDWAKDRIVVDCMQAWNEGRAVDIRSPDATRPWQHVLEPLSGYLALGEALHAQKELHGDAFNFGPRSEQNHTVLDLLRDLSEYWHFESYDEAYRVTGHTPFHEAGLLKLNCDKALFHFRWQPNLRYEEMIRFVSEWYYAYYRDPQRDMYELTLEQIEEYCQKATERKLSWAK